MDSITQIVLGASVGEVVLGKKIGNKALLFGAIAGTIPDLDVLQGALMQMISHRGFTHSFFFAFLMSPILAYFMTKIFKTRNISTRFSLYDKFVNRFFRDSGASFKEWRSLYFWGFVTHILLDVQTIYGTELLWPIKSRLTTSNIFVADPLYTVPFLLCVILVLFFKRNTPWRRNINKMGIAISSFYLLLTFVFKGISYEKFTDNLEKQGIEYQRIETGPTPLNSILWFANVETETQYLTGYYSLLDKDDDIYFHRYDKNLALRNELKDFRNFKRLNHFAKDWYLVSKNDTGYSYNNLRFGGPPLSYEDKPRFVFSYHLQEKDGVLNYTEQFQRDGAMSDMKSIFAALWHRLKGNK